MFFDLKRKLGYSRVRCRGLRKNEHRTAERCLCAREVPNVPETGVGKP